jgi:hypothetical protein
MMMSMIDALSPLALLYESENWLSVFLFFLFKKLPENERRGPRNAQAPKLAV